MTDFLPARLLMVDSQLRARGISDTRVLDAMLRVPRHEFVPNAYRAQAYADHPLPIGDDQTISQPYVVARMLELLQLTGSETALDVGTGSGYVTALLAELAAQVFSMERHAALAATARSTLSALGYACVEVFNGDGTLGLPAKAPFDAISVSAAAQQIPSALISQLRDRGRMIIPVGPPAAQELQLVRMMHGNPEISRRDQVRFVPLISDQK